MGDRIRGQFTKGNRASVGYGRPPGAVSLCDSVVRELGPEGKRKFGAVMARCLLTGELRYPGKRDKVKLTPQQWLDLAKHFCPVPKDADMPAEMVAHVIKTFDEEAMG